MEKRIFVILIPVLLAVSFSQALGADVTRTEGQTDPIWTVTPDALTWTTVTPSPTPTGRSAVGWIGEFAYLFGNETYPSVALYWHVPTEAWGNSTPYPGQGDNWTGAVLGGELYVVGRFDPGLFVPTNEFRKFTPDGAGGGTWTQLANYPMTITMLAAAADTMNGLIYAAGGYNGSTGVPNAYVYDVAGNTWSPIASLPQARLCVGGAFLNGKFYVVAGLEVSGFTYTNTLYEYDPGLGSWSSRANLPQGVAFNWSSVTTDGNYIYQVGGGGGYASWPALNAVQVYDAQGDSWFLETSLPAANGTNSALYIGDPDTAYILSSGGWDGAQYIGQTFKGTGLFVGMAEASSVQFPLSSFQFLESFPNPFTRSTTICYHISEARQVTLSVSDLSGRLVRTLVDQPSSPATIQSSNSVVWDGTDSSGKPVGSGIYVVRLGAGELQGSRTILVLR